MKAWSIYKAPTFLDNDFENNDLENEFQFQIQGYAVGSGGVNPLHHERT
jgi:hypothetical protein